MGDVVYLKTGNRDHELQEAARAKRIRETAAKNQMLSVEDAETVAAQMHRLLNDVKGSPANLSGEPLTKQRVAEVAWSGRRAGQSALSYLRHFARPRGSTVDGKKGPHRRPRGYVELAEAVAKLSGRSLDRILIALFRDTALDLEADTWVKSRDAGELNQLIEYVRDEIRDLAKHQQLPEYFRWLAQHGPAMVRTPIPFSSDVLLNQGNPTGGLNNEAMMPVISAMPRKLSQQPIYAGLFPSVPIYRVKDRPSLPVSLKIWLPGLNAETLSEIHDGQPPWPPDFSALREEASETVLVKAKLVPYRYVCLSVLPADLSAEADPAFEIRNGLVLELDRAMPIGGVKRKELVPWSHRSTHLGELFDWEDSGITAFAFDAPWHSLGVHGVAMRVLDPSTGAPLLQCMSLQDWLPFETIAEPDEVSFEVFDVTHVREYLIDWPYQLGSRAQLLLPNYTDEETALPRGSFGALFERGFVTDAENTIPDLLEDEAELLWDQVNAIRQSRAARIHAKRIEARERRQARRSDSNSERE